MGWTDPIDAYCERIGAAFWAEPVNAATNLAFLLAAAVAFTLLRRKDERDRAGSALATLVAVIGVGSFLFHTFANAWSVLADVIPIAIFIYAYFALALTRFFAVSRIVAGLSTLAFFAASAVAQHALTPILGSSAGYAPGLIAMLVIGGILCAQRRPAGPPVLGAGCVFAVSLAFRMADGPICAAVPLGTHFVWHILNATTLGLLLFAAIERSGARRGMAASL